MADRILLVLGTRPEAIKLAPVYRALQADERFEVLLAVTGQHRELLTDTLTALALSYGTFYPQFDTENAAQIPTSFGGLLFMMTAIVLIGAVAYLTGRPAARYVVAEHFGWARTPTDMLLPFAIAATACVAATAAPLMMARRRLDATERA
jgi:hypothetical protein